MSYAPVVELTIDFAWPTARQKTFLDAAPVAAAIKCVDTPVGALTRLVAVSMAAAHLFLPSLGAQEVRCGLTRASDTDFVGGCTGFADSAVAIVLRSDSGQTERWTGTVAFPPGQRLDLTVLAPGAIHYARGVARTPAGWYLLTRFARAGGTMDFGFAEEPAPPARPDLQILRRARQLLTDSTAWGRSADRTCPRAGPPFTLYCALESATRDVAGEFHHRQPAMETVRILLGRLGAGRILSHRLADFNSHPATTHAEVLRVIDSSAVIVATRLAAADTLVVRWLRANAIPVATTDPATSLADLEPLRAIVADAKLVLLGEATHGTREFFQLKHRIARYLATELGFGALVTEGEWSRTRDAMALLADPRTSPDSAFSALRRWSLTPEPARELLRWIQSHNASSAAAPRFAVFGMDMQDGWHSAHRLIEYLQVVDSSAASRLVSALRPIEGRSGNFEAIRAYSRLELPALASVADAITRVRDRLAASKAAYVAKSSASDWADAVHHARVLQQAEEAWRDPRWPNGELRDRFLAENILTLVDRAGGRSIGWAHNAHVMRGPWFGRETLGSRLSQQLGQAMVVFGFIFGEGEFRARTGGSIVTHRVGPAPEGSVSEILGRVGIPMFMVDLRKAPHVGPVADWLRAAHLERSVGAEYRPDSPLLAPIAPAAVYDVLVFVASTTWR